MARRGNGFAFQALLVGIVVLLAYAPVLLLYRSISKPADGSARSRDASTAAPTTAPTRSSGAPPLPAADLTVAPVEPVGVYHQGKVTLGGSVPDEAMAAGYLERVSDVVGAENVTMHMTLDPRTSGRAMRVDVDEHFRFPSGSLAYDPEFQALLSLGAAALKLLPEVTLVVTGHTDAVGDEGTNLALSKARAQLVVDAIVAAGGPADRIVARGAGESQPIADNATPEGREANRRVEATLEGLTPGN